SPSLAKFFCSAPVLPSFTVAFSSTRMPPSLALADKACLSASARTFFGRSIAWLRGVGPNERPPPRKRLTRAEPWRAGPGPLCRYIFFPVRGISARVFASCVPRRRLAGFPPTPPCTMSAPPPRLEAEDRVRQFDRTRRLAVERHDLELHVTRPPCRRPCLRRRALPRLCRRRPPPAGGTCRAWGRPSAASSSQRRAA